MSQTSLSEYDDNHLVARADNALLGMGALVEAVRRLRETMLDLDRAATRLTWVSLLLSVMAGTFTAIQVWAIFHPIHR
jgi:hypothetical protein